jgi:transposase-like protein
VAEPALDPAYPIVFFDALRVKIGDGRNKAVYVALALDVGGEKRVLGL